MLRPYHALSFMAFVLLAFPTASEAFVIHDSSAVALDEHTAIYSITFSARIREADAYYPIEAVRTSASLKRLKYEIVSENSIDSVQTSGRVFSDAEVVNNTYFVPRNEKEEQTLFVILTTKGAEKVADIQVKISEILPRLVSEGESDRFLNMTGGSIDATLTPKPTPFGSKIKVESAL